jgi:hypothetical protein
VHSSSVGPPHSAQFALHAAHDPSDAKYNPLKQAVQPAVRLLRSHVLHSKAQVSYGRLHHSVYHSGSHTHSPVVFL